MTKWLLTVTLGLLSIATQGAELVIESTGFLVLRSCLAVWLILATGAAYGVPSVHVEDQGIDDLLGLPNLFVRIVEDRPASTYQVELAVEWLNVSVDTTFMPPVATAPFTSPITGHNPFTGSTTTGLWLSPDTTNDSGRLFAAFEATSEIGIGVFDVLAMEYFAADQGSLDVFGVVTADGVPYAVDSLPVWPIAPPNCFDFTQDGAVDIIDFGIFADNFGGQGPIGDCDHDGDVDIIDFGLFADNFLSQSAAMASALPEPSSLLSAIIASAVVTRRRRH